MSFLGLHAQAASRLAGVIGFTYAFQTAFAAFAVPAQSDRFYDLAGSLGFISSTLLSLYYPSVKSYFGNGPRIPFDTNLLRAHHPRQLIASAMILLWAGRLGSFLFQRVLKAGKDSRFDEIKTSPAKFSVAWLGQATWITCVSLPVLLLNSIPKGAHAPLGVRDALAVGVWAAGWGLEIVADRQKSEWRQAKEDKKHEEQFISSGVWSWSRHPNYLGEFSLQFGPALLALPSLPPSPYKSIVFISPLFSYLLLRYASGVPPLEKSGEKKWGKDPKWREYVEKTSVLVPWPGGLGKGKAA